MKRFHVIQKLVETSNNTKDFYLTFIGDVANNIALAKYNISEEETKQEIMLVAGGRSSESEDFIATGRTSYSDLSPM